MELTRRDFLKTCAFLGGTALFSQLIRPALEARNWVAGAAPLAENVYPFDRPETQIYSVCLQCNTGCGIKVKVRDGVAVKIEGSPYSPMSMWPHVPYATAPQEMATVEGWICPKGQAGLQTVYDPYRLRTVLKRAGPRGSGRWMTIPFEQALEEIVNGGDLFGEGPVDGLKALFALRDPKVAKAMAADVAAIQKEKDPEKRRALVEAFQSQYAAYLDTLIDPDHPDLGPKNNQFCFIWGRLKDGRADLIKRFTLDAFGSVNAHGHTTVCQGSLYFTGKAMSEQFVEGKFTGGEKFYWQTDLAHAEFVIFVGASPFEGNYGPPLRAGKITEGLVSGRLRYVVVDPRLSKTAAKAWKWLPARPGTEGALALALIRLVIEAGGYNRTYLANANRAAANADHEPTYCNATWLVKLDSEGRPGKFLRGSDLGLEPEKRDKADGSGQWEFDPFVVLQDGRAVTFDPNDTQNPVEGELLVDTTVQGKDGAIRVKSALQLLYDAAGEHTLEEWAEICGLAPGDIRDVAEEFIRHGRKSSADVHRGASQHTNGYYNVQAWYDLNLLAGNYDYAGGMVKASAYDQAGGKEGQPFPITKMHPGKMPTFGITIIRSSKYQESTLFDRDGYPAKRPWYPLSSDIYQELLPSIGDAYPYPVKAVILYMGSPVYSLPAGHTNIEVLKDPKKLPLLICCDITVGETSMYADYIFPDLSYLERWEFHKSHPSVIVKNAPVRQPVIAPLTETVRVFGVEQPLSLEALLLGLAEKLGLSGFGPNGFGEGMPLVRGEDLYLKEVANLAFGDKKPDPEKGEPGEIVPEADDEEVRIFLEARRHLPPTVFDPEVWRAAVGDEWWRKVIYVLNRGGRFQDWDRALKGAQVANKYGKCINMYCEKTYEVKDSLTGQHWSGVARYFPAPTDALGNLLEDEKEGYDLILITYREIAHTKSRTSGNYWLQAVLPENFVLMNSRDAARLGLRDGDRVRILSKTNPTGEWDLGNGVRWPMVGKLRVIEGIRPGVVGFSLGHGHWAYGGTDIVVDGAVIRGDPRRITGLHANAAMRTDTHNPNTCLRDLVGGSAVFYDSRVKVVLEV
ncbi:MAG: molybdopterin-dependent oxidoreductase [Chloroflexia bacterium]